MEIDPVVGGGARVTSRPSGSGPSATSATVARRRTPGRWRRIPRAIDPPEKVGTARLPELAQIWAEAEPLEEPQRIPRAIDSPEKVGTMARLPELAHTWAEPFESWVGPLNLEGAKKIEPTCSTDERYDMSPSTDRTQETTGLDQLPSFRFEIVSDPNNPSNFTTVLVEKILPPVRAEVRADEKTMSALSAERYDLSLSTGLLQERRPPVLQMDLKVVVKGSRECEEMEEESKKFMLEQAKRLEEEAEEGPCDSEEHTEEDKAEFRALKLKFAAECRSAVQPHLYRYR